MSAKRGFTLIELLVVISIIAILVTIITIIINPLEITRRSRDATRLADLANLQIAINTLIQENPGQSTTVLCAPPASPPCSGTTLDTDARKTDGSGWVKVKLDSQGVIFASTLPIDPLNTGEHVYSYATNATGDKWEINAVLESSKESVRMRQDGGDNHNKYETGLDLSPLN